MPNKEAVLIREGHLIMRGYGTGNVHKRKHNGINQLIVAIVLIHDCLYM